MTADSEGLESRYRRLVALFPPAYRAARGEEIVSALMDGAAPGQEKPGLGERWDLLRAVAGRWMRATLLPPPSAMADTLAVRAWLVPAVLLYPAAKAVSLAAASFFAYSDAQLALHLAPTWPAWAIWILGVAALLLGRRRVALALLTASAALMALTIGALLARGDTLDVLRESGWLVGQAVALRAVFAIQGKPTRMWKAAASLIALLIIAVSLYSAWVPHNTSLTHTLGAFVVLAAGVGLVLTRYRFALPAIAAAAAALYVGRFGVATTPRHIPLEGLTLDPGTIATLIVVPLLTYVATAMVLSLGHELRRTFHRTATAP